MPNIVEYNSTSTLTPSDKGINAAADAARLYGQVGHQIGHDVGAAFNKIEDRVERHMAIMETSELYKTGTELKLNLQTRYETESALPENRGNPHFGDRFMAEIGPMIDEWGEGAQTDHGKQLAATLKASIRNEIFNHVAAGQSEMDAAHVDDNLTQTMNGLASGVIMDPSEANLSRSLGTAKDAIQGVTATIPDVGTREQAATGFTAKYMSALVMARYIGGVGESIKNQIAETGADTSPALDQLNKDIKNQLGFQWLSPAEQTRITGLGDEAVRQGQELYRSRHETDKAKMTEAGKADYADIHTAITELVLKGQGPTPDLITAIGAYSRKYGATNPGEVASLDDFVVRGQDRAQSNAVQPFDQRTRDNIQAGFSLPSGDPRRPTLASLTKAYSHGQITKEDFSGFTEILNKLDKPTEDPAFKPAWDSFTRWQSQMLQSIGAQNANGAGPARAQFLHDSTAAFMAQGKGGGGWDKALDNVTNAQKPHSFGHVIKFYDDAANKGATAAQWLQQHDQFQAGATTAPAYGSQAAPVYPTSKTAPAHAPAPDGSTPEGRKIAKDAIFGGK